MPNVYNRRSPHPKDAVYIGRPTKWGNPFTHVQDRHTLASHVVATRDDAVERYREWIVTQPDLLADLHELEGRDLVCWCAPKSCHGSVLLELANELSTDSAD